MTCNIHRPVNMAMVMIQGLEMVRVRLLVIAAARRGTQHEDQSVSVVRGG